MAENGAKGERVARFEVKHGNHGTETVDITKVVVDKEAGIDTYTATPPRDQQIGVEFGTWAHLEVRTLKSGLREIMGAKALSGSERRGDGLPVAPRTLAMMAHAAFLGDAMKSNPMVQINIGDHPEQRQLYEKTLGLRQTWTSRLGIRADRSGEVFLKGRAKTVRGYAAEELRRSAVFPDPLPPPDAPESDAWVDV